MRISLAFPKKHFERVSGPPVMAYQNNTDLFFGQQVVPDPRFGFFFLSTLIHVFPDVSTLTHDSHDFPECFSL